MNITDDKIEENKEQFLHILEEAVSNRQGARWEELKDKLIHSDFFYAPASTKYHAAYKGGLCQHSLNVYNQLINLIKLENLEDEIDMGGATIISLLHDFSKIGTYKLAYKNVKVYDENGDKSDAAGRFYWDTQAYYTTVPVEERFNIGNHEQTSEFMLRWFVPLKIEESAAIFVHHGGLGYDSAPNTAAKVMAQYKLAVLLHLADMLASYLDEGVHE